MRNFIAFIIIVALASYVLFKVYGLRREGLDYSDKTVATLVDQWNPQRLKERATPEFLTRNGDKELIEKFKIFRNLGNLQSHKEPKLIDSDYARAATGTIPVSYLLNYSVEANFEKGPATINLQVVKREGKWLVNNFDVTGEAMRKSVSQSPKHVSALEKPGAKGSSLDRPAYKK